jgi:REP element-mobilizing transposase RayT
VLELSSDSTDLASLLSLLPQEPISVVASKMKGRVNKWMREQMNLADPAHLLSRGYFASTVGKSRRRQVERYLSKQAEHHGYANRILPPVYEKQFSLTDYDLARTSPRHGVVNAQFHVVLATRFRKGVFLAKDGEEITRVWSNVLPQCALIKVSFVPDHVHIALRAHPSLAPADIVVTLMNSAQEIMGRQMVRTGVDRLWQPSAYIGSYGDLASAQIKRYLERWEKDER